MFETRLSPASTHWDRETWTSPPPRRKVRGTLALTPPLSPSEGAEGEREKRFACLETNLHYVAAGGRSFSEASVGVGDTGGES
ncbi:hypothetical protein SBV1_1670003 [Verrucomicrobia bacterium]|nr:hypothetical protein SBV1_1670003 [Verrucomicrobiota bacterium]